MDKKKINKKKETIDERLFRELGVKPVSRDHPIYKLGPTIFFISKKPLSKKNDDSNDWQKTKFKNSSVVGS